MMFAGIEGVRLEYILDGIILSIVFGFAIGNYACSLVFRLPRGRLILDQKPYCGTCNTPLQVKDLFPVVSALLLRHRCRYCKTPYPVSHTWTELLVGLLALLAFFKYNFGDQYVLIMLTGAFLITLAAIHSNEGKMMTSVMLCTLVCGIVFRTLEDQTISLSFQGGLVALVLSCALVRKHIKQVGHIYVPPREVLVVTLGAVCVGIKALLVYGVLLGVFYGLDVVQRKLRGVAKPPLITVSVGLAASILMLYPELGRISAWL